MSRNVVVVLALAVSSAAGLVVTAAQEPAAAVTLALINGRIYTMNSARPWAEALAINGERIVAVGSTADVLKMSRTARVIDLRGAFASPGFNDAHVHIDSTGALLVGVNLLDVHEPAAFTTRVREAAGRLPRGSWITRGEWGAYEKWSAGSQGSPGSPGSPGSGSGPFTPSRDLIDAVTPDHPVFVNRFDRSMFLANSRALELAGITAQTPNPAGGEIVKDAAGKPTGILKGTAADLVRKVIPPIPFAQRLVQVRAVLKEARESGVTTMQDLTSADQLRAYQELQRAGELTSRIMLRPTLDNAPHVRALGISRGFGDDWLKYIGYKAWVDGIMGGSSAMFFEPYSHDARNKGILRDIMRPEGQEGAAAAMTRAQHYTDFPPGNLEKLLEVAIATGLTPHIHAIGDKGNRIILDVFEKLLTKHAMVNADHRWRVIHAQVVDQTDMPRFGKLKLVAEINPYHVSDDMRWMEERIGAERLRGAYAFRKLKDAGAVLIFGSDSPGTNAARYFLNPVYGLYAAVSRQTLTGEPKAGWYPDQRLTIEEAMEAYTTGSAWASFEEDRKGTLAPDMLADIAVFDRDLIEVGRTRPADLLKAKVRYTIAGGRVVFSAN
jgi:predicted amidohydrolase YtcJ